MLEELLKLNVYAFIVVFSRIGTIMIFIPVLGDTRVLSRGRLFFALAISFIITPIVSDILPKMPDKPFELTFIIAGEIFIGIFLGFVVRAMYFATQTAGTVISFVAGMANTMVYDPVVEQQSAIISGFMGSIAVLLLFVTNMHHLLIEAMVESYMLFKPGLIPNLGDMSQMISRQIADTFVLGVQLSAPFFVVSLAYYMGLGVLTRLSPQIPVFFVAMPLQIIISMVIMTLAIGGMMTVYLRHFRDNLQPLIGS